MSTYKEWQDAERWFQSIENSISAMDTIVGTFFNLGEPLPESIRGAALELEHMFAEAEIERDKASAAYWEEEASK